MSTYVAFDSTNPAGTQTGTQFAGSANSNDVALWYAVVQGGSAPGWTFAPVNGTAEEPQYHVYSNGAQRVRATNTWVSGNITAQTWEVSQDSGSTPNATGTWAAVCTQTYSYDGSGNLTATTGAGGMLTWFYYQLGKVKALLTNFNAHAAAAGTAVHGLGTMSTQSATAVNIDGGTIDNTPIGAATPASLRATYVRETVVNLGTVSASTAINWISGGYYYATLAAGGAFTWSNLPASTDAGGITVELTNPAAAFNPFPAAVKWPAAVVPTFTASGIDIFEFSCRDGATVRGGQAMKDSR